MSHDNTRMIQLIAQAHCIMIPFQSDLTQPFQTHTNLNVFVCQTFIVYRTFTMGISWYWQKQVQYYFYHQKKIKTNAFIHVVFICLAMYILEQLSHRVEPEQL